jgi:hypothetical protein
MRHLCRYQCVRWERVAEGRVRVVRGGANYKAKRRNSIAPPGAPTGKPGTNAVGDFHRDIIG